MSVSVQRSARASADQRQRQVLVGTVAVDVPERHRLDQGEVEPFRAAPGDHPVEFILVDALERHGVDLDLQTRDLGGLDPRHHLVESAPPGDGCEALTVQRVQRDVDPAHAGTRKFAREPRELAAVGGERELVERARADMATELVDQPHHVAPNQRLAAGQPQLAHPQIDKGGAKAVELLQGQKLGLGQERHVLCHAVDAAEIAAVGDRHPHIADGPPERVDHHRQSPPLQLCRPRPGQAPRIHRLPEVCRQVVNLVHGRNPWSGW